MPYSLVLYQPCALESFIHGSVAWCPLWKQVRLLFSLLRADCSIHVLRLEQCSLWLNNLTKDLRLLYKSLLTANCHLAADRSCLHSVNIVLPKHESRTKDKVIYNQNSRAREIVFKYQHTLRSLEIALWELQEISANSVAQLKNLQKLSVRLDHPYTRYPGIEPQFWDTSLGSTVWNTLASRPGKTTALGSLRSLNLERAGITDYQLARIVESNPKLTELRLSKCFNLTTKTFKFLVESSVGRQLRVLHFTKCASNQIDGSILYVYVPFSPLGPLSLCSRHSPPDCLKSCKCNSELTADSTLYTGNTLEGCQI